MKSPKGSSEGALDLGWFTCRLSACILRGNVDILHSYDSLVGWINCMQSKHILIHLLGSDIVLLEINKAFLNLTSLCKMDC